MELLHRWYDLECTSLSPDLVINNHKIILHQSDANNQKTLVERIAEAPERENAISTLDTKSTTSRLYDSAEFDIRYVSTRLIQPQKKKLLSFRNGKVRFFQELQPRVYGLEILVRGFLPEISQFEEIMNASGATTLQAREIHSASFTFQTDNGKTKIREGYAAMLKDLVRKEFPAVFTKFTQGEFNDQKGKTEYYFMSGLLYGPVSAVLDLRHLILENGMGLVIPTHNTSFFY